MGDSVMLKFKRLGGYFCMELNEWWWMGSGIVSAFFVYSWVPKEERSVGTEKWIFIICGAFGFISVAVAVIGSIYFSNKKRIEERRNKLIEQQEMEANKAIAEATAVAAEARAVAANNRKDKILKNHINDIDKLERVKSKFENNPDQLPQNFFEDVDKLASDLLMLSKKEIKQGARAVGIIKFARMNIYNCFPEPKHKAKSEKIAGNLMKALGRL
jgi:hypothetical protein